MNSIFIQQLLGISIFKCKRCKRRCRYPVMMVANAGNYCRSCLNGTVDEPAEENTELNAILEKFHIPCRYNEKGCDVIDKINDLNEHEKICRYRDKICPLFSLNQCKFEYFDSGDICDHFQDEHQEYIVKSDGDSVILCFNIKDTENSDFIRLLVVHHENFLLHVKCESNTLTYTLYLCGDSDEMKNYQCMIQHSNDDIHTTNKEFILQYESDYNPNANLDKAVTYDLTLLKKHFDRIDTTIKITRKNVVGNIKNEDILNQLKCITCKAYLKNDIRQCSSGHSACKDCIIETKKCSICSAPFTGMRNYALEALSALLKYPCANRGCTKYFSAKNITLHELDCPLKEFSCPFRESLHCQVSGLHQNIIEHVKSEHSNNCIQDNYYEHKLLLSNIENQVICLIAFNTIFSFYVEKTSNIYLFSCKYVGIKSLAKRFLFEIGFIGQRENKFMLQNSWSKSDDDEIWVEIHNHNISQYVDSSKEILLYYQIKKYYEN